MLNELEKMGGFEIEVFHEKKKTEFYEAMEEVLKAESKLQELRKVLDKKREEYYYVKGVQHGKL